MPRGRCAVADHCNEISPAARSDGDWSRPTQPTAGILKMPVVNSSPVVLAPALGRSQAMVTLRWWHRCQSLFGRAQLRARRSHCRLRETAFFPERAGLFAVGSHPPARSVARSRTHRDWWQRRASTEGAGAAQHHNTARSVARWCA
jgi:hypothetical protein